MMNKTNIINKENPIYENTEILGNFELLPLLSWNLNENSIKELDYSGKKDIKWLYEIRENNIWTNIFYVINYIIQEIEKIIWDKEKVSQLPINEVIDTIIKTNTDKNKIAGHILNWIYEENRKKDAEEIRKLKEMSTTDTLTKLWNRRFIENTLNSKIADYKRNLDNTAILLVDIDYFKSINDHYWHLIWDDALIKIWELFTSMFRKNDEVWRWWGEEFMIIMPGSSIEKAEERAEQLRLLVEKFLWEEIKELHKWADKERLEKRKNITISIWISEFHKDDELIEEITKRADDALYEAKEYWRNCIKIEKRENLVKIA